jgi:hypothetical protein
VTVGSDLAASISRRLTPSLSAFANAQRRSGARADFGIGLSGSTAVANLAVEIRSSALHHSVSFGFDDISVGFSRRRPHSMSVLMRVPVGGWRAQLIAEMQKQEATLAAWNGTAGGRVRLRPGEWPVAEAAWQLKINEWGIHSSADTEGNVRSRMEMRLSSKCTMGVSMALAHREGRYRGGLTLDFRE